MTIEIYTTAICPYCAQAKNLLKQKGVTYEEIQVDKEADRLSEAVERSGGRMTVPQIFIDNRHVGGYDELYALEQTGALDEMLGRR